MNAILRPEAGFRPAPATQGAVAVAQAAVGSQCKKPTGSASCYELQIPQPLRYLAFPISYRDLSLMLADRGVAVDHTTLFRWVQSYAATLEQRIRRHLRPCTGSWRVDETYIKVKGWSYSGRGGSPDQMSADRVKPSGGDIRNPAPLHSRGEAEWLTI
jgi:hypothetical protein